MIPLITIKVSDTPDLKRLIMLSPRLTIERARGVGREVLSIYTEAFRYEAPQAKIAPSRGGGLKRGIEGASWDTDKGMEGEVRMPFYGVFTIPPGTRPHEIRPRPPLKALKFYWQRLSATVFFKRVWHPGYRGDPWPDRAMQRAEPKVLSIVERAGAAITIG